MEKFIKNVINKGLRIFNEKQVSQEYELSLKKSIKDEKYQENYTETNNKRRIYHYETSKIGLTQKYDKRIVLNDKVSTVPLSI